MSYSAHQASPKPTNLSTKDGAVQDLYYMLPSEADQSELALACLWALGLCQVAILPIPGHTACFPLEIWFMMLDAKEHVYTAQSTCTCDLLPSWQNVRERLGGTAAEALGTWQGRRELGTRKGPEVLQWEGSTGKCGVHRTQIRRKLGLISYTVHRTFYFSIVSYSLPRKGKRYWLLHAPIMFPLLF